jgi:hypothetical protein
MEAALVADVIVLSDVSSGGHIPFWPEPTIQKH